MKGSQVYTERSKGMVSQKKLRNECKKFHTLNASLPKTGFILALLS